MSRWLVAVSLGLLTHVGASYLVPLEGKDQAAMGGVLRWAWPWGIGDSGLLGRLTPGVMPIVGFWIAMAAAILCGMAALAVMGWWVPGSWWRPLAVAGAALVAVLMIGFFGPTKVVPFFLALAMIWLAASGSAVRPA